MRLAVALALAAALASPAAAQQIVSEYTDLEADKHCSTFSGGDSFEGDWANLTCSGWRGYPVLIYYGDARESLFYGFPPDGDLAPAWESFDSFNHAGPKIEWRIETDGSRSIPFATIHRWFVNVNDGEKPVEVLVVEKVGQVHGRDGCAVGYVVATGNANANEKARRIADEIARDFLCGDQPVIDSGSVEVPGFNRVEE